MLETNQENNTSLVTQTFESSIKINEIAKALLNAQKNMGKAVKGSNNPYFSSKYADLNSVLEACKEDLNEAGITILQPVSNNGEDNFVSTLLLHESGQYIKSTMKLLLSKNDMQNLGSAVSYARRYTLQALITIPSSEDDDGEKAVGRTSFSKPKNAKEIVEATEKKQSKKKVKFKRNVSSETVETKTEDDDLGLD